MLTSGRLKNGDLSILETAIQGTHKLELNFIGCEWMVEILRLHDRLRSNILESRKKTRK